MNNWQLLFSNCSAKNEKVWLSNRKMPNARQQEKFNFTLYIKTITYWMRKERNGNETISHKRLHPIKYRILHYFLYKLNERCHRKRLLVFWRFNAIYFTHERFLKSAIKEIEFEIAVFFLLFVSFVKQNKEIQMYEQILERRFFFIHL